MWCLLQELPRGLLKAFSDPGTQTLYLSVCTQLDPWAMVASQRHPAPKKRALGPLQVHERDQQLSTLLLLMSCDAVLFLSGSAELDVSWLSRLRACHRAWQLLRSSLLTCSTRQDATCPASTSEQDSEAARLIGKLSRQPALLLLACQVQGLPGKQATQLNTRVRGLIASTGILPAPRDPLVARQHQRVSSGGNGGTAAQGALAASDRREGALGLNPLFELHASVTAIPVPPLQPSPVAALCALMELVPAAMQSVADGTNLLDAGCFADPQREDDAAEGGMQQLRGALQDRRQQQKRRQTGSASDPELLPQLSVEAAVSVPEAWANLWPVFEAAWVAAQEQDMRQPFLMGSTDAVAAAARDAQVASVGPKPGAAETAKARGMHAGRMGKDSDDGRGMEQSLSEDAGGHRPEDEGAHEGIVVYWSCVKSLCPVF